APADLTGETAGEAASQELLQALLDALRRNDEGALRAIAALAVQQFGGINETRVGSQHYHLYRVLRHLDLSNLLQRVIHDAGETGGDATLLDDRLFRDEQRHRIEEFRRLLADEIRHRILEAKGLAAAADMSRTAIEDVDFLGATPPMLRKSGSTTRPFAAILPRGMPAVAKVFDPRSSERDGRHLLAPAAVARADGYSDDAHVFERFWNVYGLGALGPGTTVIITGDARNNYRDPGLAALRAIQECARKVYWLNPEPRPEWNTTDSIMAAYAPYCDGVFEARNLRQLADFVRAIA